MRERAFWLLLGLPGLAPAAEFTVTRLDDPLPDGCAPADCSLREAVLLANATVGADRIVLPASANPYVLGRAGSDDSGLAGDLDVQGVLEIEGLGAARVVIQQSAADRVFHLHGVGAATVLRHLELQGGKAVAEGGAVNAANAELTVVDCEFTGNTATSGGGAIVVRGPEGVAGARAATITGSGFFDNSAPQGGALLLGASITASADTVIEDTDFVGNNAVTLGGAVAVSSGLGFGSTLLVRDSLFYGNAVSGASGSGGALANGVPGTVQVSVADSHFADNHAEGTSARGGALADVNDIRRSRFETNVARRGGAIAAFLPTIEDSLLCDNAALAQGGAVHGHYATIRRSTFCRNEAGVSGGALYFTAQAGVEARIERSTFDTNNAPAGALLAMQDGALRILQSTLIAPDAPAPGTLGTLLNYAGPDAPGSGSLVELTGNLLRGRCSFASGAGVVDAARYNVVAGGDTCGTTQAGAAFAGNALFASETALAFAALADNGGPTPTRLPSPAADHPAIDRVPAASCIEPDQRYFQRSDAACDAGAVEAGGLALPDAMFADGFED